MWYKMNVKGVIRMLKDVGSPSGDKESCSQNHSSSLLNPKEEMDSLFRVCHQYCILHSTFGVWSGFVGRKKHGKCIFYWLPHARTHGYNRTRWPIVSCSLRVWSTHSGLSEHQLFCSSTRLMFSRASCQKWAFFPRELFLRVHCRAQYQQSSKMHPVVVQAGKHGKVVKDWSGWWRDWGPDVPVA